MRSVTPAFYFWKTTFRPTPAEQSGLDSLGVKKIYLRLADVDLNAAGDPVPIGQLHADDLLDTTHYRFIPTVFITARTLPALSRHDAAPLAKNMMRMISAFCTSHGIRPEEVQIDCDWTAGTKEVYFALLHAIKGQPFMQDKLLSCTIRLHQIKYSAKSGIPPVDRGMAMIYNLGNLRQTGDHNSIFSEGEARKYLGTVGAYPLPLDIALPLFSWAVHFRAGGLFSGILRDVSPEAVAAAPGLFRRKSDHTFTCTADTVWAGYPFAEGDIIRTETPDPKEVLAVARYISEARKDTAITVSLFHLDHLLLSKHPHHELASYFESFR